MVLNQTAPVDAARRKRTTLFFRRNINKIGTMGRVTATKFPHLDIPPKTPSSHGEGYTYIGEPNSWRVSETKNTDKQHG